MTVSPFPFSGHVNTWKAVGAHGRCTLTGPAGSASPGLFPSGQSRSQAILDAGTAIPAALAAIGGAGKTSIWEGVSMGWFTVASLFHESFQKTLCD
jgi:hypothetical protein